MNSRVAKSTPEEQAVIQNLASLVQQLQAMGVGDQSLQNPGDTQSSGGQAPGQGAPVQAAYKSGEGAEGNTGENAFDRTEDPQNDVSQEGPTARRPQMRNAQIQKGNMTDQEEDSAEDQEGVDQMDTSGEGNDSTPGEREVVTKGIHATENDGTQNLDDANTIIFDDLPESTKENVKDIRKALRSIGLDIAPMKRPVRKSYYGGDDDLRQQIAFLSNQVKEIIEGVAISQNIQIEQRSVRKSRPAGSYSGQADIQEVLKALVTEIRDDRNEERKLASTWDRPDVVKKSMRDFTENLTGIAGGLWPKQ